MFRMTSDRSREVARTVATIFITVAVTSALSRFTMYRLRTYGWALFVGTPVLLGFLSVAILRVFGARRLRRCFGVACLTGLALLLQFLFLGWEGLICIAMAVPLELPLMLLGAWIAYLLFHRHSLNSIVPGGGATLLAFALAFVEAKQATPAHVYEAADSVVVAAKPSQVWSAILALQSIPTPDSWFFKTGVACPQSVKITRPGSGGERVCRLSTGELVEHIEVWEPDRHLRWSASFTPPPLTELNPFHTVDSPHLHGFYRATQGEFVLEPVGESSTLLTRRTWYQHGLAPSGYWRVWCDLAASKVQLLVLNHVKHLVESPEPPNIALQRTRQLTR